MIGVRKSYFISLIVFTIILIIAVIILSNFNAKAQDNTPGQNKYYKSIVIEEGDSLWSIAKEYMGTGYDGVEEYIDELKSMNGLGSDTIHTGQHLVVTYNSAMH